MPSPEAPKQTVILTLVHTVLNLQRTNQPILSLGRIMQKELSIAKALTQIVSLYAAADGR